MMARPAQRALVGALAFSLGGCDSDPSSATSAGGADIAQVVPDVPTSSNPDEDVRIRYVDETEPRVEALPEDWATLTPPLDVVGEDTGEAGLLYAAALSAYFLVRVQQADGSYKYEYKPDTDEWLWQDVIHRQVGPGYACVILYRATGRPEFAFSADRVFDYAAERLQDRGEGQLRLADIGGTSIFIFGLSRYRLAFEGQTPDRATKWDATLAGLGAHLLALQNEDGSFKEGSFLARGQAVQAFAHLDEVTDGSKAYRDGLIGAARFSCEHKDEIAVGDLPYFLLYANEAFRYLHRVAPEAYDWAACSDAMTQPMLDDQYLEGDTDDPSWVGGYGKRDGNRPTWSASLRMESVTDAMGLAQDRDDGPRVALLREHIEAGAAFVIRQQWRKGETDEYPNPPEIIGGFPYYMPGQTNGSLGWPLSRTDLSWHGSAMLVKAATVLGEEAFPGALPRR